MVKFLVQKSEIGAGTRGSSLGPMAIQLAAVKGNNDLFNDRDLEEIPNQNAALFEETNSPCALRIESMVQVYRDHADAVLRNMDTGNLIVQLSADHASAAATIAGIKMAYPEKRLGVVWIDAHADLHSPYTSPSGNIHGMPLAVSIGADNIACKQNDPSIRTLECWSEMKQMGGITPKVDPDDICFVGVRSTEPEEEHLMAEHGIQNLTVDTVRSKGMKFVFDEITTRLKGCDMIYVSYDVDSMDPEITSHGTGTPVPGGITPEEGKELLTYLLSDLRVDCVEFVEVNPLLDEKRNKMAEVTLGIIDHSVKTLENRGDGN